MQKKTVFGPFFSLFLPWDLHMSKKSFTFAVAKVNPLLNTKPTTNQSYIFRFKVMLKRYLIVFIAFAGLLTGCSQQRKTTIAVSNKNTADTTSIPALPAEAIYLLGQEWIAIHDSTTAKYHTPIAAQVRKNQTTMGEYLDQRLTDLYPHVAYPGYVNKVMRIAECMHQAQPQQNIISNIGSELPDGAQAANMSSLELTKEEFKRINQLDRMAASAEFADKDALDSLRLQVNNVDDTLSAWETENVGISIMLTFGPNIYMRVMQCKIRAEQMAQYYYGDATTYGRRGDAFKHIFVNAMLRKYTNRLMAWLVMDVYWEHVSPNAPCDHYMDLHNNTIGRQTRYKTFTHTVDSELPSWMQIATHIHSYIEDTTLNSVYQPWDLSTPSIVVKDAEKRTSNQQYIIWNQGDKIIP